MLDPDESSEASDDDNYQPPKKERSLASDHIVPPFWGIVRVSDFGGVPDRNGVERNNAMRGMLSRNAYLSCATNRVFVGESARLAREYERRSGTPYIPGRQGNPSMVYERTI